MTDCDNCVGFWDETRISDGRGRYRGYDLATIAERVLIDYGFYRKADTRKMPHNERVYSGPNGKEIVVGFARGFGLMESDPDEHGDFMEVPLFIDFQDLDDGLAMAISEDLMKAELPLRI